MAGRRETRFEARPPGTTGSAAQAQRALVQERSCALRFLGRLLGVVRSQLGAGKSQLRGAGRTRGSLLAGELCAGESCRGGGERRHTGERRARRGGRRCVGRRPAGGRMRNLLKKSLRDLPDGCRDFVVSPAGRWKK